MFSCVFISLIIGHTTSPRVACLETVAAERMTNLKSSTSSSTSSTSSSTSSTSSSTSRNDRINEMINSPFAFTCLYPNVEDTKMNSKNKLDKRIHEMCKIKILMDDVDNYDANNEQNEQLYVKEKEVSDMQQNLYRLELELKGLEEQEEKEDEEMVGSSDSSQNKRKRTVD